MSAAQNPYLDANMSACTVGAAALAHEVMDADAGQVEIEITAGPSAERVATLLRTSYTTPRPMIPGAGLTTDLYSLHDGSGVAPTMSVRLAVDLDGLQTLIDYLTQVRDRWPESVDERPLFVADTVAGR